MDRYADYFLNSSSSVVQLELLDITHNAFSRDYHVVRNSGRDGLTVTLETGQERDYEYYPLRINPVGVRGDLDAGLRIDLGDLGEIIPAEIENVKASSYFATKPVVTYRVYRSDDLSFPIFGPLVLEIIDINVSETGASFTASAPVISVLTTGEFYNYDTLRGFL